MWPSSRLIIERDLLKTSIVLNGPAIRGKIHLYAQRAHETRVYLNLITKLNVQNVLWMPSPPKKPSPVHTYCECTGCRRRRRTRYINARTLLLMDAVCLDLYGGDGWERGPGRVDLYRIQRYNIIRVTRRRAGPGLESISRPNPQPRCRPVRSRRRMHVCARTHELTRDPVHNNMYNIIHNNVISSRYVENK